VLNCHLREIFSTNLEGIIVIPESNSEVFTANDAPSVGPELQVRLFHLALSELDAEKL
jgi:hypothetical protein